MPLFRRSGLWVLMAVVLLTGPNTLPARETRYLEPQGFQRVLILYSYNHNQTAQQQIADALESARKLSHLPSDSYVHEFLDVTFTKDKAQLLMLRDYLAAKYKHKTFDLIITVFDAALRFLIDHGEAIAPDSPCLALYNQHRPGLTRGGKKVIQSPLHVETKGTMALALELFPRAQRVVFVTGSGKLDREFEARAREAFAPWEKTLTVTYTGDLPLDDLLNTIAQLTPEDLVIYGRYTSDVTGKNFNPRTMAILISQVSPRPVFCLATSHLDTGGIGGVMVDVTALGVMLGRALTAMTTGEPTELEPVSRFVRPMFNWEQVRRWDINPRRLPADSVFINRPQTIWSQYRSTVIGTLALIVILIGFIISLIIQGHRRKLAEQAARESEERYRLLFDNMLDGFAVGELMFEDDKAVDFKYIDANPAHDTLTGIRHKKGRTIRELVPGIFEKNPELPGLFERVSQTGSPERFETFVHAINAWLALSVYSVKPGYIAVLFDNITSRKKAEESLRLFKALVDRSTDAIGISNPEGRHYYQNRAFDDLFGDIGPNPVSTLYTDETVGDTVFNAIMKGGSWQGEIEAYAGDGRILNIFLRAYAIKDHDGRILGLAGLHNDITAQKQSDQDKARLQQQLYQSQKMEYVGRLAGGVAHDFNNMLGVILGHLDLIMDGMDQAAPLFAELMEIKKAGERSADLTRQLLAFARKQTALPKVIDLNETVEGLLKMIRRLIGEDIDLIWSPGKHLSPVKIDPGQIDQMMVNLCLNARDAIGGVGTVTIESGTASLGPDDVARFTEGVPGDYVTLEIRDNGCGMDAETRDRIFEPFFTTKVLGKGTGLGLSTVYGMVRQNKGFIDVVSEPDQGTTFRIFLPPHQGGEVEKTVPVPADDPVGGHETILVVEDEEAILDMITLMLTPLGYTVLSASRPEDAVTLARSHPGAIDLLITDVIMPGMNGRDLAGHIEKAAPGLKCLFMSGYTADVIGRHGVLDRRVHFIQKPFSKKTLSVKVRRILDGPRSDRKPQPM
ncbi:hypothetical protein JCM14469_05900 [Desulfatiferula olefinivorans]